MANDPKQPDAQAQRAIEIMLRSRTCLRRWSARYTQSDHARDHVRETNLIVQEIDDYLLAYQ